MPSVNTVLAVSLSLAVLSAPSYALSNYGQGGVVKPHVGAARHNNIRAPHVPNRMIKKRQLFDDPRTRTRGGDGNGAETTTSTPANTPVRTTTTQAAQTRTTTTAPNNNNAVTTTTTANQDTVNTNTATSATVATESSLTSAVASTTTQTLVTSATSVASQNTAAETLNLNPETSDAVAQTSTRPNASTKVISQTFAASSTATAEEQEDKGSSFGKNSMIAIAVIASCVAAAVGIWTLIRKWKLSPSKKFEDRMQPIEWSPDGVGSTPPGPGLGPEKDAEAGMTEKHRRAGSTGSHGSFHSADHNLGRNVTGNTNMFADQQPSSLAPAAHDFTAGPADGQTYDYNQAVYNYSTNPNDGYVDLQRGNSGRVASGAEPANPAYDYDYPPTHAAYDNNAAYGTGANLNRGPSLNRSDYSNQDPYGGYDNYPAAPAGTQQGAQYVSTDPYAAYGGAYGQGYQTNQQQPARGY
ncbi:hypothetical protein FRC03_012367 [Tulasnella sp. 419]|nr:hypothetical protein FRC03_012367 [Tulasnella sp. 419]